MTHIMTTRSQAHLHRTATRTLAERLAAHPADPDRAAIIDLCQSMVGATITTEVRLTRPGYRDPLVLSTLDPNVVGHHIEGLVGDIAGKLLTPGKRQRFPDYWSRSAEAFEVKAYAGTPGFDVGQFSVVADKYARSRGDAREHLLATYLVFEYSIEAGVARIDSFRELRVWELVGTGSSRTERALTVQAKRGQWFALRPVNGTILRDGSSFMTPDEWVSRLCAMVKARPGYSAETNEQIAAAIQKNCAAI